MVSPTFLGTIFTPWCDETCDFDDLHNTQFQDEICKSLECRTIPLTVADPGFPVGGRRPVGGVPTSNMYTFWQKCMRK